jgi:hypothetical protein
MINKTEMVALDYLCKTKGYKKELIIKNPASPDFLCPDGKRYEIKRLYGQSIMFYDTQVIQMKNDDIVLVFNTADNFVAEFFWKDKDKQYFKVDIVKRNPNVGDRTKINLSSNTKKFLKKHAIDKGITLTNLLLKIIEDYVVKNGGKKNG